MTELQKLLAARIAATGPITVADYMAEALLHPEHGYYTARDPFGTKGDFITAPDISQMFGELVGLSLAQAWLNQGAPAPFYLVELGPGRGTLMQDALRATRAVPGFADAARVHLIEASPRLRAQQAERVPQATWHDRLDDVPEGPLFLIANEFLDALPIRQFQRDGTGWRERMVGLVEGELAIGVSAPAPLSMLAHRLSDTSKGDIVELCAQLPAVVSETGRRIAAHGGAALFVDYGDWRSLGDTLQAIEGHASVDPISAPGTADITAHVDFEAVAQAAAPARHSRLTTQGVFLERLGITARARALAAKLAGAELEAVVTAHRRLTHPTEMGDLFKVMALFPDGATPPPGCEA